MSKYYDYTGSVPCVTYQTPRDERFTVCPDCEEKMKRENAFPRGWDGSYFSGVYLGLHQAHCQAECHPVPALSATNDDEN